MRVMVPVSNGFEEIELVTIVDILRRAGIDVIITGLKGSFVEGSHGLRIFVDRKISDVNAEEFDGVVIPGGSENVRQLSLSSKLKEIVTEIFRKGKLIAAICAAPLLLGRWGILEGKKATIYPGLEKHIPYPRSDDVVIDGNVITSQGPGTAIEFSLAVVEKLVGNEVKEKIRKEILFRTNINHSPVV